MAEEVTENEGTTALTNEVPENKPEEQEVPLTEEGKEESPKEESDDSKSEDGKPADKDEKEGAPEDYEFTFEDGVEVDEKSLESAKAMFKEAGLTQEQANKFVEFHTQAMKEASEAFEKNWSDTVEGWVQSSKDDKEFGGKAFDENVAVARKGIEAFGTDEFKEMLNFTGVGDHPEMIRLLYRVGKAVSEDKLHQGTHAPHGAKTIEERLFPNMK